MKGVQIFLHSVRLVTTNLVDALRVSLVPYAIQMASTMLIMGPVAMVNHEPAFRIGGEQATGLLADGLLVIAITAVTFVWAAIAWHRYVLKGELQSGWAPALSVGRSWSYLLRSVGIFFICVVLAIPLGLVVALGVAIFDPFEAPRLFEFLVWVFFVLPISYVSYRLSAALPASAVDTRGPLTQGWTATEGAKSAILVVSIITTASLSALPYLASTISNERFVLALIWEVFYGWAVMMIGLSILTTLYGHYVEGRPLA